MDLDQLTYSEPTHLRWVADANEQLGVWQVLSSLANPGCQRDFGLCLLVLLWVCYLDNSVHAHKHREGQFKCPLPDARVHDNQVM
jgi:hypothetical protein